MKTVQQLALCTLCVSTICCTRINAQDTTQTPQAPEPKTKIEAFEARTGVVVIRGFSTIGSVRGDYGGNISVGSKEFLDASSGEREYGMTIEVKKVGAPERKSTSYIDYDEIQSLIKGIDYISKAEPSITRLDNFQADYQTKGDFKISTFSRNGQTMAAVSSGLYGEVSVSLPLSKLVELKGLVENAKAKLDAIR